MKAIVVILSPIVFTTSHAMDDSSAFEKVAPSACGILLAKVVEVKEVDLSPMDGPKYLELKVAPEQSTGRTETTINLYDLPEGNQVASPTNSRLPPDVPRQALRLTPQLGQSYWFAFEMRDNYGTPEILQVWESNDKEVTDLFKRVILNKQLKFPPFVDRNLGITIRHTILRDDEWEIHAARKGSQIWSAKLKGTFQDGYFGFFSSGLEVRDIPSAIPESGKLLLATSRQELGQGNSYDLPKGLYDVVQAFDPVGGQVLVVYVFSPEKPIRCLAIEEFDPKSAKVTRRDRFVEDRGDGKEPKQIRQSTFFDPKDGSVQSSKRYVYSKSKEGWMDWQLVESP